MKVISDYVKGFGGKFGVQTDRQDKSAVGWDHHEAPQKHESQTDHKVGFGGKFGLQTDRFGIHFRSSISHAFNVFIPEWTNQPQTLTNLEKWERITQKLSPI